MQNPYTDLRESYWAYGDLLEATIKHEAADWHKLNYNEENLNMVTERFVDEEGSEIADPITSKGQVNRTPREFSNRVYLGYTTEITYVYHHGNSVLTGSKDVDRAEARVGDTLHYSITVGNDESANATLRNAVVKDTIPEHLGFVYGSVLVDGENGSYQFDMKSGLLTVKVGDLAPGEKKQVTFAAIVKDTAYGESLSNTAILSADRNEDKPVTEIVDAIEGVGFFESIPLWLVSLLASLIITVLSFILILTVYSRFFRLYMYTALAPLPLASFAGEGTSSTGKAFLKSYIGVCAEGIIIVLACLIYSAFLSSSTPAVDSTLPAVTMAWEYMGQNLALCRRELCRRVC